MTDAQIAKKLDEVKKQYFGGSQTKFEKGLKDQGYTEATLREDIRSQLLTEGIYDKVTNDVKVTDADVETYYEKNKANYAVAESRSVRHILVKTKAEADKIYSQLEGGADFAALAKKNSLDPGSKDQGGKLTVTRGQTVAPFDKAAFSLKTNQISQPVKTQFGYHVIQPLSDVKPGSVTPLAQVKAQIKTQLESETQEHLGRQVGGRRREGVQGQGPVRRRVRAARHVDDDRPDDVDQRVASRAWARTLRSSSSES